MGDSKGFTPNPKELDGVSDLSSLVRSYKLNEAGCKKGTPRENV